jgi:hypothetical protein
MSSGTRGVAERARATAAGGATPHWRYARSSWGRDQVQSLLVGYVTLGHAASGSADPHRVTLAHSGIRYKSFHPLGRRTKRAVAENSSSSTRSFPVFWYSRSVAWITWFMRTTWVSSAARKAAATAMFLMLPPAIS